MSYIYSSGPHLLLTVAATIIGGPFILCYGYGMYRRGRIFARAEFYDEATFRYTETIGGNLVMERCDDENERKKGRR